VREEHVNAEHGREKHHTMACKVGGTVVIPIDAHGLCQAGGICKNLGSSHVVRRIWIRDG
jgi:hypothetical protein